MSELLRGERLITLAAAVRSIPGSRGSGHLHPATLTRWIVKGSLSTDGRRVRLEAVRVGHRWLTSAESIGRFFAGLTHIADASEPVRSPSARQRASEAAARELDRLGA